MGDLLSPDEVHALLAGLAGEQNDAGLKSAASDSSCEPYDFSGHEHVVLERPRTLSGVHHDFARSFRRAILRTFRRDVEVEPADVRSQRFGDFAGECGRPALFCSFSLANHDKPGVVALESEFVFSMLDCFLGGEGRPDAPRGRRDGFTAFERGLVQGLVELMLAEYRRALGAVCEIEVELLRCETEPDAASGPLSYDEVWVSEFLLDFGESREVCHLCLPDSLMETIRWRDLAEAGISPEEESIWQERIRECLLSVAVECCVEIGATEVPAQRVLDMTPGDVIRFDHLSKDPLDVLVERQPRMRGSAGSLHGNRAVRITDIMNDGNDR